VAGPAPYAADHGPQRRHADHQGSERFPGPDRKVSLKSRDAADYRLSLSGKIIGRVTVLVEVMESLFFDEMKKQRGMVEHIKSRSPLSWESRGGQVG